MLEKEIHFLDQNISLKTIEIQLLEKRYELLKESRLHFSQK
jgi:hypothetical protein